MSDLFTAQDRLALGLELSGAPRSVTQEMGLGNLGPSSADWAALQQATVGQVAGLLRAPPAPRAGEQGFSAYYNPTTNQMFAGGRTFDARDVGSALQAAQALTPSPPPPGGGWQAMNQRNYADFIAGLAEPRGTGELLARGARSFVGGTVSGVGRAAEMLGAPGVGGTIAGFGEAITGQDEFDRQRSALIQQRQGLGGNIIDAAIESLPNLLGSAGAAVGGGLLGGLVAGPGGAAAGATAATAATALARARTIGAIGGLVATSAPQQISTMYDAAANARTPDGQPAYRTDDPEVRRDIFLSAGFNTLLDVLAPSRVAGSLSRALTDRAEGIFRQTADAKLTNLTGWERSRSVAASAAMSALGEAGTEATQTLVEQATFDPQFRSLLTANDWKALAPYIVEQYGENALVAAGAGALLGAGFGGVGRFIETRPRDILQEAAQPPAPPAGPLLLEGPTTPPLLPPPLLQITGPAPAPELPPGAAAPSVIPLGGPQPEMFPGQDLGRAPPQLPEVPAVEQPLAQGVQPDMFGFLAGAGPATPPPVVPQRPPLRTAANLIPPTPSVPTGAEALRRPTAQAAPTTLAETEAGNRLLALRRQMELQQAEAQRAAQPQPMTAAERDYEAALAQAAANRPFDLDVEAVVSRPGSKLPTDNARRAIVREFNALTKAQQDTVLADYGNSEVQFLDRVRAMQSNERKRLRDQITAVAGTAPAQAVIPAVPQAAPATVAPTPAARLRGGPRAAETGQVAEGRVEQRPAVDEGRAPAEAGRGNRALRRGAQPQAQAQEVAAPGGATQRPLEQPAPARAAPGLSEADRQLLTDYGATESELRTYEVAARNPEAAGAENVAAFQKVLQDARRGVMWWGGNKRVVTPEIVAQIERSLADARQEAQASRAKIAEQFANAEPNERRNLAPIFGSDAGGGTRAQAEAWVNRKVSDRENTLARAQRQLARATPAPVTTPARAAAQGPNYDELIARAERNGELRELRADLEARIDRESEAGRNTAELSRALARVDERLAAPPAAATAEGVLPPDSPQSRWAAVMDDEGTGYNRLSPEARREWDRLVNTGTLPTAEMARQVEREFPSETTQRKLAVVARRKRQLDEGQIDSESQLNAIFNDLNTLAGDADPTVAAAANEALGRGTGKYALADWNTRSNWKNADGTDARPMAPGRAQMLVQNFLSKLATKPKVTVVANQQALRTSNPTLFAQANAARPQGDFATANAAGYSFGDGNVIIFTDRIANEQHLNFVLAHETFGHFGLRGIMPRDKFDAAMEKVYDADPQAQAAADAAMEVRGLSKSEAVEEYLSDYASMLATSTVARVWNAIKRFLNALGVKSGDSVTRYLLDQSRRYVREGRQGAMFESSAVMSRAHTVESGINADGRYSPAAAYSTGTLARAYFDKMGVVPTSLDEAFKSITNKAINARATFNDFKDKFLRLSVFKALDNPGSYQGNQLLGSAVNISMAMKTRMNENLRAVMNSDKATQDKLSKIMYAGRSYKIATGDRKILRGPNLVSIDSNGDVVPNEPEVKKLFNAGLLTLDQIRNGFSWTRTLDDGTATGITDKFDGYKDFSQEDYEKYKSLRQVVLDAEIDLLAAEYAGMLANRRVSFREMAPLMKSKKVDKADRVFVDAYVKKYGDLHNENADINTVGLLVPNPDSMKRANDFLEATHKAFLAKGTDLNADIKPFFKDEAEANKFIDQMMAMRQRRADDKDLTPAQRFILQNEVKALFLNTADFENRQRAVRRNVSTGFVSVVREGNWQTRVQGYVNGKPVEVKDIHQQLLIYSQFQDKADAKGFADFLNTELKGQTFKLLVRNDAGNFEVQEVELRAEPGAVLDAVSADPQLNLQQFLYGLSLFNIDVNPRVMEKIVTRLSRQGAGARGRLEFSQTPGFDDTMGIRSVSRYTERMASATARAAVRPRLRELLNRDLPETAALWDGNEAGVERLRQEYARVSADPNASQEAKNYYKGELTFAENMLRKTRGTDGVNMANKFYNDFASTVNQLDGNQFVDESDFFADPLMARIRAYTAMAQLGGSVAQAVLNSISPYTNWMPYMATKNDKTGFGAGFGIGRVQAEYHKAYLKIGARGAARWEMNDAGFYTRMSKDPAMLKQFGMTADEARVVAREILEGKLQPAQNNALMGMARGTTTNKWALKFMDGFMSPFNLSEQAARRAAFLAAYRLYRERARAAGLSERDASNDAREKAVLSLDLTLGEYSVMNRPPAWRSGPTQFLYMYKTYPTTVIQTMRRLSRTGQLSMLGGLWLLAGVTGLPFAEDLEDLIDTLAQQLGFQQGSIRAEIIRHLEDVIPGWSPIILKGWINQFGLADLAARTGMGNILPGTSMGLAGANVAREIGDILGPAAGFVSGVAGTARDIVTYPFSSTKTLEDIARNSPVTLLRMMGDAAAYYSAGAVVDRRGYVVSPEMDVGTLLVRLFGFYPERAATQYDIIRIAQRETDYQKEVVAAYRQAWIKATMRGDTAGAQEIVAAVNSWNETTRGTALEITRFVQNSQRALREAQRGAGERALRAAPRAAREDIQGLVDALTE